MQIMPVLFSIEEVSFHRCAWFAFLYIVFCFNYCWAIILMFLTPRALILLDRYSFQSVGLSSVVDGYSKIKSGVEQMVDSLLQYFLQLRSSSLVGKFLHLLKVAW